MIHCKGCERFRENRLGDSWCSRDDLECIMRESITPTLVIIKEEVFSDKPNDEEFVIANRRKLREVNVHVSVEDTETFKTFIEEFKNLQEENKILKTQIATCEEYLGRVGECDMCKHSLRSEEECKDNCKYEVRYG
jgi:hypothetical protein